MIGAIALVTGRLRFVTTVYLPAMRDPYSAAKSIGTAAYLADGTLAGSSLTMDRAFARLTSEVGLSLPDAAIVCATTPARALGLQGFGVLAAGAMADLVVLDRDLRVVQTWVSGVLAWQREAH